jgi:TonB family protein
MHGPVTVVLRVSVNRSGSVADVSYVSPGPGNYFARISERAAHAWQFIPPEYNGRPEPSVWILRFYFSHRGTEVSTEEASR